MPKTANSPSRRPHMDAGNIRPWIEQYVSYLVGLGHTPLTVNGYSEPARHFAHWTCQSGVALSDVDDGTIEQFAQHKCQCPGGRHLHCVSKRYMYRVRDFVRFLAQAGIIRRCSRARSIRRRTRPKRHLKKLSQSGQGSAAWDHGRHVHRDLIPGRSQGRPAGNAHLYLGTGGLAAADGARQPS